MYIKPYVRMQVINLIMQCSYVYWIHNTYILFSLNIQAICFQSLLYVFIHYIHTLGLPFYIYILLFSLCLKTNQGKNKFCQTAKFALHYNFSIVYDYVMALYYKGLHYYITAFFHIVTACPVLL